MRWLILLAALSAPAPALAQACLPRDDLIEMLEERYAEHLRMQALTTGGRLIEMYLAQSGSWTIVLVRPDGMACPVLSGQGVEMVPLVEGDPA
ncbi:hypothetical protein [Roseovarius sp. MBR-6]|jgi:hypothetical protein|uniref:hypothetical protein n=1 Tax=Roseovarius sp. MBR-6 TaxID=3156459 RepID=UPI003391B89E